MADQQGVEVESDKLPEQLQTVLHRVPFRLCPNCIEGSGGEGACERDHMRKSYATRSKDKGNSANSPGCSQILTHPSRFSLRVQVEGSRIAKPRCGQASSQKSGQ